MFYRNPGALDFGYETHVRVDIGAYDFGRFEFQPNIRQTYCCSTGIDPPVFRLAFSFGMERGYHLEICYTAMKQARQLNAV